MGQRFLKINVTPMSQKNRRIGNCSVRAMTVALGEDYKKIARKLGYKINDDDYSYELDPGVELSKIKRQFDRCCSDVYDQNDILDSEDEMKKEMMKDPEFRDGYSFDLDADFQDEKNDVTVGEFMSLYAGNGVFCVGCSNPKNLEDGHLTLVVTGDTTQYLIDSWDCRSWLVDSYLWIDDKYVNENLKKNPISLKDLYDQYGIEYRKTVNESTDPFIERMAERVRLVYGDIDN